MNIKEEQELVKAAQENVEAFEALYDLYLPKVYGFVMGKIRRQQITEDLVSEIFLKILEALPRYQFRGLPFGAWVFQIARNHLRDYYGKSKRQEVGNLEDTGWLKDEDELSDPAAQARQASTRKSLVDTFHVLNKQEEEVVRLKYFSDLSNKEIAATIGVSPNNVGVILFRALKKLKAEHD